MLILLALLKERLAALGYTCQPEDEVLLDLVLEKVVGTIKNDCNLPEAPEGLQGVALDMAAGEFLQAKKTFTPDSLAGLDLAAAVKQVQAGDTTVMFAAGEGSSTPEQRLNQLINNLLNAGRSELSCYRRFRW